MTNYTYIKSPLDSDSGLGKSPVLFKMPKTQLIKDCAIIYCKLEERLKGWRIYRKQIGSF